MLTMLIGSASNNSKLKICEQKICLDHRHEDYPSDALNRCEIRRVICKVGAERYNNELAKLKLVGSA